MKKYTLIFLPFILLSFIYSAIISREDALNLISHLRVLDIPMPKTQQGEWLAHNPEPGQNFNQFYHTVERTIDIKNKKIYLKPIGAFDLNQNQILNEVSIYLSEFYNCKVVIENSLSSKSIPKKYKRKRDGILQINTDYINYKILYPNKPHDALAYMAITTEDLFPSSNWNFVFGQADQLNKIGVSSIARYKYPDSLNFNKTLQRIIKTSTHEIGHMLGLEHCINACCLMNGSNGLKESDSQPQTMCSECVVKFGWRLQSDLIKRDSSLSEYYKKHHLINEYNYIQKRLNLLNQLFQKK